ncbi:MAG: hypothetical protein AVO35_12530 [Candidatus Aegiribacteria sp. MLS_C]|nr:MAG: hypothetical protein AVO35_12530 [Candidatus Aegiribacteria sp. MLS_C]
MMFAAAAVAFSCGNGETDREAVSDSGNGGSGEGSPSHLELEVIDTIGVELGAPEYVFGFVADAARDSEGNVLVLDASTMNLRVFSPEGLHLRTAGRQGAGPGEFQMPRGMAVTGSGDILVSDITAGVVSVFDDSLRWKANITDFFPRPPVLITAAGDSAFVGMLPEVNREEGLRGFSVARMEGSAEPSVVYAEELRPFDPSTFGPSSNDDNPVFVSGPDGSVFISWPGTDAVEVTGYTAEGEQFLSISEPIERVAKTEEEIAREKADFQEFTTMSGRRVSRADVPFEPAPWRRAVSDLGLDSMNRLWVRLGTCRYPYWKVYDMEGELLFTASLRMDDPDIDDMKVRISENGIAAWVPDPSTWPRVFVVEDPGTP